MLNNTDEIIVSTQELPISILLIAKFKIKNRKKPTSTQKYLYARVKKQVVCVSFCMPKYNYVSFFLMCKKRSMKSMDDAFSEMKVIF